MWDACMTWLSREKPASGTGGGFGKASRGTLGVCAHLATFSGALAVKDPVFKVKVMKGGKKPQTNKPMHRKRKKVAFCTSENPG